MTASVRAFRRLLGAVYSWSAAVFFGAVLVDVAYSRLLDTRVAEPMVRPIYAEVSDVLLILGGLVLLAGLAATVAAWSVPSARNLFGLSLLVILTTEFLTPIVLFPLLRSSPAVGVLGIMPCLRLSPLAVASCLALAALRALYREPN